MPWRVGTAGWSIPPHYAHRFPEVGSHLERYAGVLNAVEINSTFRSQHRASTFNRWREAVPKAFRFSVKCPRLVTHESRLQNTREVWIGFLASVSELEDRLGPILIQLPPSLSFDRSLVTGFLDLAAETFEGQVVLEPRHPSWFRPAVELLLIERRIARVAAHPPPAPGAAEPGGFPGIVYRRLHGHPRRYRSSYPASFLHRLTEGAFRDRGDHWVIFDNTVEGHATANALELMTLIRKLE